MFIVNKISKMCVNQLPHLVVTNPLIVIDCVKFYTSREKYILVNYIGCGLL